MNYKNEQELYLDLLNSRQSAFEHIYSEYRHSAMQLIKQKGADEEEAKDIFQESVISLWQNIQDGKYKRKAGVKMSTYLLQVCKYKWYDKLKSASKKNELPIEDGFELGEEGDMLQNLISEEYISMAQKTFAKLGDNCQKILTLFYYENLSMDRIAELVGLKVTSATNQKYRCMQQLRSFNELTLNK